MSLNEREVERIAQMYIKYLNGPLGKGVMQHLKEGESFTIKSQDDFVRISKKEGKAVVRIIKEDRGFVKNKNSAQEF